MKQEQYKSVDEVYKSMYRELCNYARTQLIDRDSNVDAVHEAFENLIKWHSNHPDQFINPKIVYGQVLRACRRINRHNPTVSLDDPAYANYFRTV